MSLVAQALNASGVAAAVVAALLALRMWRGFRKTQINWRVVTDQPLQPESPDITRWWNPYLVEPDTRIFVRRGFMPVGADASTVLLRMRNPGRRPVQQGRDWATPLTFTFPDREVIIIRADLSVDLSATKSGLVFRELFLKPKGEVRLAVLLDGPGHGVSSAGLLSRGRIVQEQPERPRLPRRVAFAVTEAVLLCLAFGLPSAQELLGKPVHPVHVAGGWGWQVFVAMLSLLHGAGTWGWPTFVALVSLLLGAAGFAVGQALPGPYGGGPPITKNGAPPATARRGAFVRGYLDSLTLPWPRTPQLKPSRRSAESGLAADLRELLTRLGADDAR